MVYKGILSVMIPTPILASLSQHDAEFSPKKLVPTKRLAKSDKSSRWTPPWISKQGRLEPSAKRREKSDP